MKTQKILVTSFGKKMQQYAFTKDNNGIDSAIQFIGLAILRGDSISVDVVAGDNPAIPEYLKDYVSL